MRQTYNPEFDDDRDLGMPRIRFSGLEVQHIMWAVVALTVGFAYVRVSGDVGQKTSALIMDPLMIIAAFLAVGLGFVGHELAHKVVAQRYGHWAEFRASFPLLAGSVLLALFSPFFFAAPGAVMILGRVSLRENGIISLVGPLVNIVIALIAVPFTYASDIDAPLPSIMGTIALVNALLAVFNLVPAGPLDGRKVLRWSKLVWAVFFFGSLGLFVWIFLRIVPFG